VPPSRGSRMQSLARPDATNHIAQRAPLNTTSKCRSPDSRVPFMLPGAARPQARSSIRGPQVGFVDAATLLGVAARSS
jgi:hypothetical protein